MPTYADAISSIESGGRYGILGPVTRTGDRAYGKYQVMGQNVPEWSQAALGRRLTPQEFLASPELQDAVFQHRFGQYVAKHGPEGAARAWFAGEGGMNDPNRKDQLGTSVQQYGNRFMGALGGAPAQPMQPSGPPGLLAPQAAPDVGLLAGMEPQRMNPLAMMNMGQGLMGGMGGGQPMQAPAPPPMMPMPKRQIDLTQLLALARG